MKAQWAQRECESIGCAHSRFGVCCKGIRAEGGRCAGVWGQGECCKERSLSRKAGVRKGAIGHRGKGRPRERTQNPGLSPDREQVWQPGRASVERVCEDGAGRFDGNEEVSVLISIVNQEAGYLPRVALEQMAAFSLQVPFGW